MFAIWDEKVILKQLNPPSLPPIFLGWDRCHKSPPKIAKSGHCRILRKCTFSHVWGYKKPNFEWPKMSSETNFPMNAWGYIWFIKMVLDFRLGHQKCPNRGRGKGHLSSELALLVALAVV